MPQSDQSTASRRFDAPGRRGSSDLGLMTADATDLVRQAGEVVRALVHPSHTGAGTTRASEPVANPATLPAFIGRESDAVNPIVNFRPPSPPRQRAATFYALQEWEGYVLEIDSTEFVARLVDLTAGSLVEEEEATIPLAEIAEDDLAKMREGSVFRWVIGYERSASGTKRRVSQIVFRDLPVVTRADLQKSEKWARETIRSLGL